MSVQTVRTPAQPSAQAAIRPQPSITPPQPTERLETVRKQMRFALAEVSADYILDFETRDSIARALVAALRELEALQLSVAVLQRKAVAHV